MFENILVLIPGLLGNQKLDNLYASLDLLKKQNYNFSIKVYASTWKYENNNIENLKVLCNNLNLNYVIEEEQYQDKFDSCCLELVNQTKLLKSYLLSNGQNNKTFNIDYIRKYFAGYYKIWKCFKLVEENNQNFVIKAHSQVHFQFWNSLQYTLEETLLESNNQPYDSFFNINNTVFANIIKINYKNHIFVDDSVFSMHIQTLKKILSKYSDFKYFLQDIISIIESILDINFGYYLEKYNHIYFYMVEGMQIWAKLFIDNNINICSNRYGARKKIYTKGLYA